MKKRFDVVVAGAGMVGLAFVNFLLNGRRDEVFAVTVVDGAPRPVFSLHDDVSLRVSAVSAGSAALLDSVGAWSGIIDTRACAYQEMRVWDASGSADGAETLRFSAAEFAVPQLGHIVENVLIQSFLLGGLEQRAVDFRFDSKIAAIEQTNENYLVTLESGDSFSADLLVGADGASSFVRGAANIPVSSWNYSQQAFVTHLQPEKSHASTAWQRFLRTGPIGLLPLADGRVSTVWSTTPEQAGIAMAASDSELEDLLTEASDGVLGRLQTTGQRGSFPLRAQHADRYVLPRLALVGDAAHTVHPLAGQGVNLGFADAAELASTISLALDADEHPGDLPVLRRYERARKGDNKTMLHFVDGINRLFSNDSAMLAKLRTTGMQMFNHSGAIRRKAVNVALGLD